MRISDWSSDVCSSDLIAFSRAAGGARVLYVTLLSESHERLFQALATRAFFDRSKLGDEIVYITVFKALRDEGQGECGRAWCGERVGQYVSHSEVAAALHKTQKQRDREHSGTKN